jgi:hypothetical protein
LKSLVKRMLLPPPRIKRESSFFSESKERNSSIEENVANLRALTSMPNVLCCFKLMFS